MEPSSKASDVPCEAVAASVVSLTSAAPEADASPSKALRLAWSSRRLASSSFLKCSVFMVCIYLHLYCHMGRGMPAQRAVRPRPRVSALRLYASRFLPQG